MVETRPSGQAFLDLLIPEESRGAEGARISQTLAGSASKDTGFEGVVSTRSGRVRTVHWQLATASSDTADEVVLFAIGRDTTEQVALADTARQREKLAAVGTLAAGLAHEIRNPLNGAQLHLAYLDRSLKRSEAPHDLRDAVTVVADEIKRLATLVTEFLDFARPKPLETKSVSLRALCDRSLQRVAAQAAAQNVALHQDLPSQDVMLEGDPGKLEQVLLNLLHNAVEASSEGRGTAHRPAQRGVSLGTSSSRSRMTGPVSYDPIRPSLMPFSRRSCRVPGSGWPSRIGS